MHTKWPKGNGRPVPLSAPIIARLWLATMPSVPNKPVLPTAHAALATSPPHRLRRHIGQPFGRLRASTAAERQLSL
jgi:hypothetical protein